MMMTAPPPPPIPYPTKRRSSKHAGTLQTGKSTVAPKTGKSDYLTSKVPASDLPLAKSRRSVTPPPATVTSLPTLEPAGFLGSPPLIGSNPTGKGIKSSLWSALTSSKKKLSASKPSQQSPQLTLQSSSSSFSSDPPSGPFSGAAPDDMMKGFGSLLPNKTGMAPPPAPVSASQEEYSYKSSRPAALKVNIPSHLGYISETVIDAFTFSTSSSGVKLHTRQRRLISAYRTRHLALLPQNAFLLTQEHSHHRRRPRP